MACNCNKSSKTCEPCAFCTPPGVTNLPQCTPPDPCDGIKIDAKCVEYVGPDASCIGVHKGDDLWTVLFILAENYISIVHCCDLAGTAAIGTTTTTSTSTTSTTSTTTTSTTTTTTIAPTCKTYTVYNPNSSSGPFIPLAYSYTNCELVVISGMVNPQQTLTFCVYGNTLVALGCTVTLVGSGCLVPTTTTTSTTTLPPCHCYEVFQPGGSGPSKPLTYTDCSGTVLFALINPGVVYNFCARVGTIITEFPVTDIGICGGSCPPTTTTTTTLAPSTCYRLVVNISNIDINDATGNSNPSYNNRVYTTYYECNGGGGIYTSIFSGIDVTSVCYDTTQVVTQYYFKNDIYMIASNSSHSSGLTCTPTI